MANNISPDRKRKGYSLLDKYSDPVATLRGVPRYAQLLSEAEPIMKRMEREADETNQVIFNAGPEYFALHKLAASLVKDSRTGKKFRGVRVYEHALEVLTKEYPCTAGYLNLWYNGTLQKIILERQEEELERLEMGAKK